MFNVTKFKQTSKQISSENTLIHIITFSNDDISILENTRPDEAILLLIYTEKHILYHFDTIIEGKSNTKILDCFKTSDDILLSFVKTKINDNSSNKTNRKYLGRNLPGVNKSISRSEHHLDTNILSFLNETPFFDDKIEILPLFLQNKFSIDGVSKVSLQIDRKMDIQDGGTILDTLYRFQLYEFVHIPLGSSNSIQNQTPIGLSPILIRQLRSYMVSKFDRYISDKITSKINYEHSLLHPFIHGIFVSSDNEHRSSLNIIPVPDTQRQVRRQERQHVKTKHKHLKEFFKLLDKKIALNDYLHVSKYVYDQVRLGETEWKTLEDVDPADSNMTIENPTFDQLLSGLVGVLGLNRVVVFKNRFIDVGLGSGNRDFLSSPLHQHQHQTQLQFHETISNIEDIYADTDVSASESEDNASVSTYLTNSTVFTQKSGKSDISHNSQKSGIVGKNALHVPDPTAVSVLGGNQVKSKGFGFRRKRN